MDIVKLTLAIVAKVGKRGVPRVSIVVVGTVVVGLDQSKFSRNTGEFIGFVGFSHGQGDDSFNPS